MSLETCRNELFPAEKYWVDRQPWLLSRGYQLRTRFQPGWVPSWVTHPPKNVEEIYDREDFLIYTPLKTELMDAVRLSDNKQVMMKRIYSKKKNHNNEQFISEFVSSPEQLRDPTNHCVPLLETLRIPEDDDHVIIVMPLLRDWNSPRFDTMGEALDMIHQAFEGIQYLHRNHIAHCDCSNQNFMMDGSEMYPHGFHPIEQDLNQEATGAAFRKYTRTQCPPRYYWIDFRHSRIFDPSAENPTIIPLHGDDMTVPELRDVDESGTRRHADPYAIDIYCLGNMLRMSFTEGCESLGYERKLGFEFLKPLLAAMVQADPKKRPKIDECIARLEELIQSRSSLTLRSQFREASDHPIGYILRFPSYWARRVEYVIRRIPAIPRRRS